MSLTSLERSAVTQAFSIAQPAAGAEWSLTVPTGLRYRFETLTYTFTTSATVANRQSRLHITDGVNPVWVGGSPSLWAAVGFFTVGVARLGVHTPTSGSGVVQHFFFPEVWLPQGYVLKSATSLIDPADQYSAVRGLVSISADQT